MRQLNSSDTKKLRPSSVEQSEKFNPMNREYLYETSKILKFFKSGTIPVDFPKATSYNSKKEYKRAIIAYVNQNPGVLNLQEVATHKQTAGILKQINYQDIKTDVSKPKVQETYFKRDVPVSKQEAQLKIQKQHALKH
ncbi:MAG: hypothetical protein HYU68_08790 [Bacteroidetes bacterium]|nr:hypothetical protein [Bacteroidota bacterium]